MDQRLDQQFGFLAELDKLKDVLRQSLVAATHRNENSAEHSWHIAMMALVLSEHLPSSPPINLLRVLKMVLIHDIIEIDAGDSFLYDATANATKVARETAAAERIFSLLPSDQTAEFRQLWDEFEAGVTAEAKWAQGLDRLQAVLQNIHTGGASWRRHHIAKSQILERNRKIGETMPEIWAAIVNRLDQIEAQGIFHYPNQES